MTQKVSATAEALKVIERLKDRHGPVAFLQCGGGGEDTGATCLTRAELIPRDGDLKLGAVCGAPVFVDREEYRRLGEPALLIDVAPGAPGTFSLEEPEDVHFVSRPAAGVGRSA
ncbi:MAG: DUF779 domain-containing protein [Solirubrobacterales bacterium]